MKNVRVYRHPSQHTDTKTNNTIDNEATHAVIKLK